jgi:ribose transport system substrate-binding protein
VVAVGLAAALGVSVAAATTASQERRPPVFAPLTPTKPGSGKGLKLGYISLGESIAYIRTVTKGLQANAKIAGAQLVVCDSKLDAAAALDCAKTFKTEGVQGILNFQVHEDAAAKICAAGPSVPVIAIDIPQKPCQISFLGVSNFGAGIITGQGGAALYKRKFGCKYDAMFIIGETASGSIIRERRAGMMQGWESVCGKIHDLKLLQGTNTPADAQRLTTDALTAVPGGKVAMMSLNGDMTLGALAAIRTAGREDDVHIIGFGADKSNLCDLMKNRSWLGDSLLFPEHYGQIGIQNIIRAIKHQPVPKTLYIKSAFGSLASIPKYYPELGGCKPS